MANNLFQDSLYGATGNLNGRAATRFADNSTITGSAYANSNGGTISLVTDAQGIYQSEIGGDEDRTKLIPPAGTSLPASGTLYLDLTRTGTRTDFDRTTIWFFDTAGGHIQFFTYTNLASTGTTITAYLPDGTQQVSSASLNSTLNVADRLSWAYVYPTSGTGTATILVYINGTQVFSLSVAGAAPIGEINLGTGIGVNRTAISVLRTSNLAITDNTATPPPAGPQATNVAPPVQATGYSLAASPASVPTGSPSTITASLTGGTTLASNLVITLADSVAATISGTITIANGATTGTATVNPTTAGAHAITATHTGGGFTGGDGSTSFAATAVVVPAATLTSIALTPTSPAALASNGTQQFAVVATYSDNSTATVTGQAAYNATAPGSINAAGLYTGPAATSSPQTSSVTATFGGKTSNAVTVTTSAISSSSISPIDPTTISPAKIKLSQAGLTVTFRLGVINTDYSVTYGAAQSAVVDNGDSTYLLLLPSTFTGSVQVLAAGAVVSVEAVAAAAATVTVSGSGLNTAQLGALTKLAAGFTLAESTTLPTGTVGTYDDATAIAALLIGSQFPADLSTVTGAVANAVWANSARTMTAFGFSVSVSAGSQTQLTQSIAAALPTLALDGGAVVASPVPTTTGFSASGPNLTAPAGGYIGQTARFQSGTLAGVSRVIVGHTVTGSGPSPIHGFTLAPSPAAPLPSAPASTDAFVIV